MNNIIKINNNREKVKEGLESLARAQHIFQEIGIPDISKAGIIKEIAMAYHLDHDIVSGKKQADACDTNDSSCVYEYSTCQTTKLGLKGNSFAMDDMRDGPPEAREKSLNRIKRNNKFYLEKYRKNTG